MQFDMTAIRFLSPHLANVLLQGEISEVVLVIEYAGTPRGGNASLVLPEKRVQFFGLEFHYLANLNSFTAILK
jgi:hypothetical protein